MNRNLAWGLVGLAVLLATTAGCLESKMVVNVQKDGSGTVEHTMYMKDMGMMGMSMEGAKQPSPEEQLQSIKASAEKNAAKMGEGVTVKSVEALPARDQWKGYRTVYAFTDISKIKVTMMPEMDMGGGASMGMTAGPDGPGADPAAKPANKQGKDVVTFQFASGETPKLTVVMPPFELPSENAAGAGGPGEKPADPAMMAMMGPMFDGMLIELQVKVAGTVTNTDARYLNKSKTSVGLARMEIGSLFKDQAAMKKMQELEKIKDEAAAKEALKDPALAKYMMFEMKEKIEIEFK